MLFAESKECVINGDPHFYTYDGARLDYMGVCYYTLSATCNVDPGMDLEQFEINIKPEIRNGKTHVSWTKWIDIDIYGHKIRFLRGLVVQVRWGHYFKKDY